jgi:ATP-dependent helicase/nuclease subunit B
LPNVLYLSPNLDTALNDIAQSVVESQQTRPFSPITILLPDGSSVQATRKRLGDTIGVRFYQFYGLGQMIIDGAGLPVHRITDTAMRRLVRKILGDAAGEGRLSTFSSVWETPGFQQVLVEWLREMKSQGIAPEAVQTHARTSGEERDRQLAEFYSAYQTFMIQHNCSDADGLLWLAAEVMEDTPHLPIEQQRFIALGFDQFNPLQIRILRKFAAYCDDFRIYLPWDIQRPPDSLALSRLALTRQILEAALAPQIQTLDSFAAVDPALEQIRRAVFEPVLSTQAERVGIGAAFQHIAAPSRTAEVRWALKSIKRLLLDGAAPDQIALLAPHPEAYQRIVEVAADEYGIPLQLEHRLGDTPVITFLLTLLNLAPEFPWRETMAALRSPYLSHPWLTQEQINQLDQLSRERPVLGGREQWRFAFQPIDPLGNQNEAEDEDLGPQKLASRLAPEALADIDSGLTAFFDLLTPPQMASCRDYALWLQQALLGLFPESEEDQAPQNDPPASLMMAVCCQSGLYARRDTQALVFTMQALRALVEAAELVSSSGASSAEKVSWVEFRADMTRILPALTLPSDPLQSGVRFAAMETGRSQVVDHLFVFGLAEGEFPRLPAPDVLYASREREMHPLPLIRPRSGEQASLWWQVLSNCRRSLTLLRPCLDEKGAPWLPSSYWEAVVETVQRVYPALREIELPIVAQPSVQDAASPAELLIALANGGALSAPDAIRQPWISSQAAFQLIRQRQGWQPVPPHEGLMQDPAILAELDHHYGPNHNWSASRLNRYGNCPFSFFAQAILRLQALEDPAEGFDAMKRGTLLHAILEQLFHRLTTEGIALTPANLPAIEGLLEDCCASAFHRAPERYGFRPDALWRYEQAELRRLLTVLLHFECDQNCKPPEFHPFRQELRFGIQGSALPSLRIETQDGFAFSLHGVIDRLDRDDQGRLRLVDYKSGSTTYSKQDILKGLAFQSPLYALAAEQLVPEAQVIESYFLHIPKREKSGRLTYTNGVTGDEIVRAAVEQAALFVQDIRQGVFPTLPAKAGAGQNACTSTCEFSGLCRANRHSVAKARQQAKAQQEAKGRRGDSL